MRWLLLIYALLSFLVAGGLLFKRSGRSTVFLGLFTLLFGIEMIDYLYSTSEIKQLYPQLYGYYYLPAGFLYGPLLWWHFLGYVNKDFRFSAWRGLHFLPFLIVFFYLWDFFTLLGLERMAYVDAHFREFIMPVNYARASHLLLYGILLIMFLYQKRHQLRPKTKLYIWSITLIYFLSCVVISWLTEFADTWRDFEVYYVVACNIIFIIGFLLYTDPAFLTRVAQKYLKSMISGRDKKRIRKKIEAAFSNEDIFSRNDLSMNVLSDLIREKSHHISQTFSEEIQETYHSYVNQHRVEYAKKLFRDPQFENYTIEAIGQEAGFNNRVSFNNAFKEITSITPSEYRKQHLPT